jgi:hypothetical protein
MDRWMRCNACGITNTLFIRTAPYNNEPEEQIDLNDEAAVRELVERAVRSIRKKT